MIPATLLCAVACLVLVGAEYKHAKHTRTASKIIASLAFIVVGVLAGNTSTVAMWILSGLVLGAVGDVALLGKGDKPFLVGLVAFLLGHIAYVVAIAQITSPAHWATLYAIAPIIVGGGALMWLWPHLREMKLPVIVYVLTIVTMVIGALAVRRPMLTTGAILFFASDLAVARDKFVEPSVTNRAWGLPCYYAGQLLIAWSLVT